MSRVLSTPNLDAFRALCRRVAARDLDNVATFWRAANIPVFERWVAVFFHTKQSTYHQICTGFNHPMGKGCQLLRCRATHECLCCGAVEDHGAFMESDSHYLCPWMQGVYMEIVRLCGGREPTDPANEIDRRLNAILDEQHPQAPARAAPVYPLTASRLLAAPRPNIDVASREEFPELGSPKPSGTASSSRSRTGTGAAETEAQPSAGASASGTDSRRPQTATATDKVMAKKTQPPPTAPATVETEPLPPAPGSASTPPAGAASASAAGTEPSSRYTVSTSSHAFGTKALQLTWRKLATQRSRRLAHVLAHNAMSTVCTGAWSYLPNREVKVAVKIFPYKETDEEAENQRKEFQAEVDSLLKLSTKHVVRILDHSTSFVLRHDQEHCCVVMERLDCNLAQWVQGLTEPLSNEALRHLVLQLLANYAHCHAMRVAHRDVKPENVLVVDNSERIPSLRLCDFAFAKVLHDASHPLAQAMSTKIGTIHEKACWIAPEVDAGRKYKLNADLWPLGVMLMWLASEGVSPIQSPEALRECHKLSARTHFIDTTRSRLSNELVKDRLPLLVDLVHRMAMWDPAARLHADHALTHPYLWSDERLFAFLLDMASKLQQQHPRAVAMAAHVDQQHVVPGNWQELMAVHFDGIQPEHRPSRATMLGAADVVRHLRNIHQHWAPAAQQDAHQQHQLELSALADDIRLHLPDFLVQLWEIGRQHGVFARAEEARPDVVASFTFHDIP